MEKELIQMIEKINREFEINKKIREQEVILEMKKKKEMYKKMAN